VELLERAAQYRVTFTEDLKQDAGDANRFIGRLALAEGTGIDRRAELTRPREGRVADVVSVTRESKAVLDHHRDPDHNSGQMYYSGW